MKTQTKTQRPLTVAEVQQAFTPLQEKFPPILSLVQAAELSGYTPATLKKKLSEDSFQNSVARGKPLRFWRDRFVLELMQKSVTPARKNDTGQLPSPPSDVQEASQNEAA